MAEHLMLVLELWQEVPLACISQQWPPLKTPLSRSMGPHGQLAVS